jgi:putative ABC transport system permease protein
MSRRKRMLQQLDDEIREHIETETQDNIARGMSPEEARYAALRKFGNVTRVKEDTREVWSLVWLEQLLEDLRFGLRMLRKNPGFTAVAVLTLALGIGANTALFSVVNGVLLRPLPYRDPNSLVVISLLNNKTQEIFPLCDADFLDWRAQNQSFAAVAAFSDNRFNITGPGVPEQVLGDVVTADFFSILGVTPVLGRTFLPDEDQQAGPRLVVLSYGLWQNRYGSNPGVIGKEIVLNGSNFTVIGVMPRNFLPSSEPQLWTNLLIKPPSRRGPYYLTGEARLKPGVTLEQARADLGTIARRIERQNPLTNSNMSFRAVPLEEVIVGDVRPALLVLFGAVAFVLLIASANVANLLLARASVRAREVAIRAALGASRARLTMQLLTESTLLAAIGGLFGLLLAKFGVKLLLELGPSNIPRLDEITIDARVLAFTCVLSLASGILFGLVPAVDGGRSDLNKSMKEGGRSAAEGKHRSRARGVIVVTEIALSLILLIGGGLMLKSFYRLQTVSPGVNANNALTMQISLPPRQYDDNKTITFYRQLIEKLQTLADVEYAGVGMALPPNLLEVTDYFTVEGQAETSERNLGLADLVFISPDYFRALGVPLIAGRYFTTADGADAPKVAIINQTLARHYWPNQNAVGKRIKTGGAERPKNPWMEVVGVVGDVKYSGLDAAPELVLYQPHEQSAWSSMYLVLRTSSKLGHPTALASAVQKVVWSLDKDVPVAHIRTLEQLLSDSVQQPRFRTVLLEVFALIALSLAALGIYGVLAYSVSQRRHEIGIRMALGAQRRKVLSLVVGQGMLLTFIGVTIGLVLAFALARFLSTLLYAVRPTDPSIFIISPLVLACVALLACYIPARRAMRVDPMVALRYE